MQLYLKLSIYVFRIIRNFANFIEIKPKTRNVCPVCLDNHLGFLGLTWFIFLFSFFKIRLAPASVSPLQGCCKIWLDDWVGCLSSRVKTRPFSPLSCGVHAIYEVLLFLTTHICSWTHIQSKYTAHTHTHDQRICYLSGWNKRLNVVRYPMFIYNDITWSTGFKLLFKVYCVTAITIFNTISDMFKWHCLFNVHHFVSTLERARAQDTCWVQSD